MKWYQIQKDDLLILEPEKGYPNLSVIFLHGLGANGFDFVNMSNYLFLPVSTRFLFPHASKIQVRLLNNERVSAWYDLGYDNSGNMTENIEQLQQSAQRIVDLIIAQKTLGVQHVVLGGFSQGAALVLWILAHFKESISGYAALSGYLIRSLLKKTSFFSNRKIFISHGELDQVIPLVAYEQIFHYLCTSNHQINRMQYANVGHTVCDLNFEDLGRWVAQVI